MSIHPYTTVVKIPQPLEDDIEGMATYAGRVWLQRARDLGYEPVLVGDTTHLKMQARYDPGARQQFIHVQGPIIDNARQDDDDDDG